MTGPLDAAQTCQIVDIATVLSSARNLMAGFALRHRTVMSKVGRRVPMTPKAEVMKACLDAGAQVGAVAAVTADAATLAGAVGEVVMTQNTRDRAVLLVR